jgi:regulation of enolase protein 1 (concanavalin A-like superfamily)
VANGTALAGTVSEASFDPGSLEFGRTYYWRVDEVNEAQAIRLWEGEVWSFSTQEYLVVEDFDGYSDEEGSRIYESWIDGWTNGSGSQVGNTIAPFAEQMIVHGGKQSMPMEYNNVQTPFYSEAQRSFDTTQNWMINGADTLSLYFRGRTVGFADKGNNAFAVCASGGDIWNDSDQFRFAYKALSGNGSIAARVDSIVNTHPWAKAGVMIRETLEADSRNACLVVTPGQGVSYQWRDTTRGLCLSSALGGLAAPYWVRITRTGNVFRAEWSPDGKTWTRQGTDITIPMAANAYIGLAVSSHDVDLVTTAEFANVSATGTVTGPWQAVAIGAIMAMPRNDPAPLYLTVEDQAGKSRTVVHANAAATTVGAWAEWRVPLSDLSSAGVNVAAVKKLTVGVGDRNSPKTGGSGVIYLDDIGVGHPLLAK